MKYAPILVLVYNRPDHFKKCIEALKSNNNADKTILYIASDGSKDANNKFLVDEVRDYIKKISGFKDIKVFAPTVNTQKRVFFDALRHIRKLHDRYIITEDDNVCSRYFIDFVNEGLEKYQNNMQVTAICGHNYPGFPSNEPQAIALSCFSPWGYGVWRDRDIHYYSNQEELIAEVFKDRALFKKINYGLPHIAQMLRSILKKELMAGDVPHCVMLYKTNKVCIFPSLSLVRNIGNDGSGEHCAVNEVFTNQAIYQQKIGFLKDLNVMAPENSHRVWLHNFFGGKEQQIQGWLVFYGVNSQSKFAIKIFHYAEFWMQVLSKYLRLIRSVVSNKKSDTI